MSRIARSRSAALAAIARRRPRFPASGTSCSTPISTNEKSDSPKLIGPSSLW